MIAYTIDFEPVGRRGQCPHGKSLLDYACELGVGILRTCGGKGKCHSCKVQVLKGTVSEPTSSEREVFSSQELADGWRLACQTYPTSDCKLGIPPLSMTTPQRMQVEGLETAFRPEPAVRSYRLEVQPPSLSDSRADAERILESLNQQHQLRCQKIDIGALRELSPQLRSWNWQCQALVRSDEVIALNPWSARQLGLAIDLGTTKIAGYLVDLNNGQTLAAKGIMNPQISYGEDIVSRMTHVTESPSGSAQLKSLVVEALNQMAVELCAEVNAGVEEIVDMVVVGNTAMHHLFLGLPVRQLALSPCVPAVSKALDIKARDLGLRVAPGAYLHLLPNIAGFVGADHVAMLLATGVSQARGVQIAIDIGTNTEVSLIDNGNITSVSCASGPAFEGGHIKDGMRAASGAIERLRIENGRVEYQTIDGLPPVGICGSGILDAMAQLYLAGVINKRGRMADSNPRVRTRKNQREFTVVNEQERNGQPAIIITQQDVREVQLAKAAIRSGIQVLLDANGRTEKEIEQVVIAGAFGSYIDVVSAVTIGMLPLLPPDRFKQVGNAAGVGAKLALLSRHKRAEAETIASRVRYIELASAPGFMQTFIQACYMGSYKERTVRREA